MMPKNRLTRAGSTWFFATLRFRKKLSEKEMRIALFLQRQDDLGIGDYRKRKKGRAVLSPCLCSLTNEYFRIFPELIRNRNENELCVGFALGVPLPEVGVECRIKECIADIAPRNTVCVKTNRKQLP